MAEANAPHQNQKITRDDIEHKVREIEAALHGGVDRAKPQLLASGIFLTLLIIAVAYLFGRKVGTRRSALVEVKRI